MTTFMIRYKTMERFDLQICKKSYTNGSRVLVNISCKSIIRTSVIIDVRPHRQSFLIKALPWQCKKGTKYI